jgi:hypothetical protein
LTETRGKAQNCRVVRRLMFLIAIVLAVACCASAVPNRAVAIAGPHASNCCFPSHPVPSTHSPERQQAHLQDAADHAIVTPQTGDRLAAAATIVRVEPGAVRDSAFDGDTPPLFDFTPRYLRTFVLLI